MARTYSSALWLHAMATPPASPAPTPDCQHRVFQGYSGVAALANVDVRPLHDHPAFKLRMAQTALVAAL